MPRVLANGINIYHEICGQGEPLVLIMGFGGSQAGWVFQKRFFRRHFQVITFDNRGAGKSDKTPGPYTIRLMAEDTIALMDQLEIEKAHMLGVSMGGYIAQELAINYPERVRKLVLGCTYARQDDRGGHTAEYFKLLGLREGCPESDLRQAPARRVLSTAQSLAFNGKTVRVIAAPLMRAYVRLIPITGASGQFQAIAGHNTFDRLPMIKAPTLVITGTGDRLIKPGSAQVLADLIPDSRLVKIEGGSHSFFIGKSGRFNREVLDFLKS